MTQVEFGETTFWVHTADEMNAAISQALRCMPLDERRYVEDHLTTIINREHSGDLLMSNIITLEAVDRLMRASSQADVYINYSSPSNHCQII